MDSHRTQYSEISFWDKVKKFAMTAGRDVIGRALVLYYCLQDPNTPAKAKTIILGALGYFISPIDAIPDFTPAVGYTDDMGALVLALTIVSMHINKEHREKAKEKLAEWFGDPVDA